MCGIVSYFGNAPDTITRLLTGMSAIIYRAPDSTGIGMFGNLDHPVVLRKTLGSVSGLIGVMLESPFYENPEALTMTLGTGKPSDLTDLQDGLLDLEGLSKTERPAFPAETGSWPSVKDLVSGKGAGSLVPGIPGRPCPLPAIRVRSRKDLRAVIRHLLLERNISPVIIQSLFRKGLQDFFVSGSEPLPPAICESDVFNAFDHLFQTLFTEYRPSQPARQRPGRFHINPGAQKHLWRMISAMPLSLPSDFDPDGIRGLFRILDQALVSAMALYAHLDEVLQKRLAKRLPHLPVGWDWKTLYRAEKGANLYGQAAAVALAWLLEHHRALDPSGPGADIDPRSLTALVQPAIGHGRWAIQSAVTLTNSHPFTDKDNIRAIVLNGQFSPEVEDELAAFLTGVAGITLRTENSAEYFAQLWGYYCDRLGEKRKQYQEVKDYVEKGLEEYALGVSSINYQILKLVHGKSMRELDEMAFVEAAGKFTKKGGQIAVAGISLASPGTLYVAASKRPVFVVRRKGCHDYMVVSDVNAAIGLFSQSIIAAAARDYDSLARERENALASLGDHPDLKQQWEAIDAEFSRKINGVLSCFSVEVFSLDGDDVFARIGSPSGRPGIREIAVFDFKGTPLHTVEPVTINLTPPNVHRDLDKSFFESHMEAVPDLLEALVAASLTRDGMTAPPWITPASLVRRFGKHLKNMRRILIAGMGTSFHVSRFASCFARTLLPDIQVVPFQPVDVRTLSARVDRDTDFVILVTWSGTTADMVRLAKRLKAHDVLFVAVTEKTFGDTALMARKSCGIIPAMSGEEVTVPAVKSTFCTLMALELFLLWLVREPMGRSVDPGFADTLSRIPFLIRYAILESDLKARADDLAFASASDDRVLIIDALHTNGTGDEGLIKLQEMTWSVKGMTVDYSDVDMDAVGAAAAGSLVIVNATTSSRLDQALEIMEQLNLREIPFYTITVEDTRLSRIRQLCLDVVIVSRMEDCFQPFMDLVFYYYLALSAGKVRGRTPDDYPRNRAKSVTASRSTGEQAINRQKAMSVIRDRNAQVPLPQRIPEGLPGQSPWTAGTFSAQALNRFRHLENIATDMVHAQALDRFFQSGTSVALSLGNLLFTGGRDAELLLLPLDRSSQAAALTILENLEPYLPCRIRVVPRRTAPGTLSDDCIVMTIQSSAKDVDPWEGPESVNPGNLVWIAPQDSGPLPGPNVPGPVCPVPAYADMDTSFLYAGISLLLIRAWSVAQPDKSHALESHFRRSALAVTACLKNRDLACQVRKVMEQNRRYTSMLLISPPDGTGMAAAGIFARAGHFLPQSLPFGAAAHGALVTVENRLITKYVRLKERCAMVREYGQGQIAAWEEEFLGKTVVDDFMASPVQAAARGRDTVFFAEGDWFFPVLRPGFPAREDNLILIDASSETCFDDAMDEVSVFGCRYAQMVVITQDAFACMPGWKSLVKYPMAGLIRLPSLPGYDQPVPLSDMHLPFVLDLVTAAMAGVVSEQASGNGPPPSLT